MYLNLVPVPMYIWTLRSKNIFVIYLPVAVKVAARYTLRGPFFQKKFMMYLNLVPVTMSIWTLRSRKKICDLFTGSR